VGVALRSPWRSGACRDRNRPPPPAACILGKRSYIPVRAGASRDGRVPIILRHPDARPDYPGYLAMLEFDLDASTAR